MKKKLNADLASVNENLYDDLFIQKLETRLETDPLGVGGLVDIIDSGNIDTRKWCVVDGDCPELGCVIDWN